MKEIVPPAPPAIVRNDLASIRQLFDQNVLGTYARYDLAFVRGEGSYLWDVAGKRYLDFGGGVAVTCLGHANPEIAGALAEQSRRLLHVSNLYYHEWQGRLAQKITQAGLPGKCFFCNSGAEANEGLFKLARRFGHDEGRFEIITARQSFHGRTLAGIAATGQDKVKKGFEPAVPGFVHAPFGDLDAIERAITPATAAVLMECIQGEGGLTRADPQFLLGLRKLCDQKNLLLLLDEVQSGHFRTGRFYSFQRLLEGAPGAADFAPDGISMAKSLGGGFPIGAFWIRDRRAALLGPGSHATTFGGAPLGCAVALKIFGIIERDRLADNARDLGERLKSGLERFAARWPEAVAAVRGCGLILGLQLGRGLSCVSPPETPSAYFVKTLHQAGLLAIPAGPEVVRFLPALNLKAEEADEGLAILESVLKNLARPGSGAPLPT